MSPIKKRLIRIAAGIEDTFDSLTFRFRQRLNFSEQLQIVPYRSYGTPSRLYVKGRVLVDKGIKKSLGKESFLRNLLSMYKRFESDEVPGVALEIRFQDRIYKVTSDDEGYFVLDIVPDKPILQDDLWLEVGVTVVSSPLKNGVGLTTIAPVLIPPGDAEYGVISDIDDTIIHTSATNLMAMSRNTFFHNAHSRLPFAGVSEFYKALQLGRNGKRNNPFFYVSSSPWNLYDLLVDFMDLNDIPEGPLLLRDFGLRREKITTTSGHMGHKFHEIENLMMAYPALKFVLIGDSGQEDPAIYREVVKKFPGRILAAYIRDVQLPQREKIAMDIAAGLVDHEVEMIIADNTLEAAEHALSLGLIEPASIAAIQEDKMLDKGEVAGKEKVDGGDGDRSPRKN